MEEFLNSELATEIFAALSGIILGGLVIVLVKLRKKIKASKSKWDDKILDLVEEALKKSKEEDKE